MTRSVRVALSALVASVVFASSARAGAESRREFDLLLGRASAVVELDGAREPPGREGEWYEAAGRLMLGHSDVLIAIWDGQPAAGRGGTAEIVAEAVELGVIAALPQQLSDAWEEDVRNIIQQMAILHQKFGVNFALGAYDAATCLHHDVLTIDSPQPNRVGIERAIGHIAQKARAPRAPRPPEATRYLCSMPRDRIVRRTVAPG